ncbi:Small glutamine-rich tetratricopeptide repeat-containing protein 2 [Entomophthora muscae]|uniref:Small glutamine-rich tetratricopeptide repeat-containing protein 2 n=1 Tax=Entomophthora muscae TaxID=34485 RepID=A0ACC2SAL9_9FUNG|nr:Small glutamine-rich tetratricopeptide repeat-containing protein 2 [Entomophthora muscae]
MDNKKQLVFSILEFFQTCVEDGTLNSEQVESLEVATHCIGEVFGVDTSDEAQKRELSIKPATLSQIFNVFLKTQKKAQQSSNSNAQEEKRNKVVTAEDKKRAEELKAAGNTKVTEKKL